MTQPKIQFEGWLADKSKPPTPLNAKRLLNSLRYSQADLCRAISQPNGKHPSQTMMSQILNRDTWPTNISKFWLRNQIADFLRGLGVSEDQIETAFEIDETPYQLQTIPPSTTCKLAEESSPIAYIDELPEPEMLSQKAKKHFRLFQDPFADDVQNVDDLFLSEEHRYIRETMFYAARQGRFIAIVGESGSGKSTLRRDLLDRIQIEGHQISVIQPRIIDKERLSAGAICDAIINDLGEPYPKRSLEAKARQIEQLLVGSSRAGNSHVLIIEEAHDLNVQVLKQLKRFWELEDGFKHLLGIILIGQPELQHKLDERRNWQAREVIRRCEVATLEPIDRSLGNYLALKFKRISRPVQEILSEDAMDAIRAKLTFRTRGGTQQTVSMLYPLNINNLVRRGMNLAADIGSPKVTADIIREV